MEEAAAAEGSERGERDGFVATKFTLVWSHSCSDLWHTDNTLERPSRSLDGRVKNK